MHSNIETTIDRFLAEVVERGIVTDLEPLRTRIIRVERRPMTTTPNNRAHDECEEGTLRVDEEPQA